MVKEMSQGNFKKAFHEGKNRKPIVFAAGCVWMAGKFLGLLTKVKDPYEPKKHTWIDTLREDYIFKTDSLIEAAAGTTIAINAIRKDPKTGLRANNISFAKTGEKILELDKHGVEHLVDTYKPGKDYISFIGGLVFSTGYLIRYSAKFGEKQINLKELNAHISDTLALTKPEEIPQLAADSTAAVKNDLKGKLFNKKPITFGELYTKAITDLEQHHKIALPAIGAHPHQDVVSTDIAEDKSALQVVHTRDEALDENAAKEVHKDQPKKPDDASPKIKEEPETLVKGAKIVMMSERKISPEDVKQPAASFVEKTAHEKNAELGIGA